jgi:hypothetical protein
MPLFLLLPLLLVLQVPYAQSVLKVPYSQSVLKVPYLGYAHALVFLRRPYAAQIHLQNLEIN